jgi:hypothetical protein
MQTWLRRLPDETERANAERGSTTEQYRQSDHDVALLRDEADTKTTPETDPRGATDAQHVEIDQTEHRLGKHQTRRCAKTYR